MQCYRRLLSAATIICGALGSFASARVNKAHVAHMPAVSTPEDGVAFPLAFATACYAFTEVARLSKE